MLCSNNIDIVNILLAASIMLVLGGGFAVLLAFLGNKLAVKRDERIDEVKKYLSGANCGGCGRAGCDAFAEAVVKGEAKVTDCPSSSPENKKKIMEILHLDGDVAEPTVAVVRCIGGNNCKDKYSYQGYGNCNSVELLSGGRKECPVGCAGLGSCTDACKYYAVDVMTDGYAKVKRDKCTSCGLCIKACPKHLIERIPVSQKVYVACSNNCKGRDVKSICDKGCISCGLCVKSCEAGAIVMEDNLPKIDPKKCTGCYKCVEKCPVKVILKTDDGAQNG